MTTDASTSTSATDSSATGTADRPVVLFIIGSTRPTRIGGAIGEWIVDRARQRDEWDVRVTDLRELDLPFLDEPKHPRMQDYQHEHTKRWSAQVSAADAVVLVHPEYNFSFSAPVKNAIDYLNKEWADKVVLLASYGGISAGLRAATALRIVFSALQSRMVPVAISIPWAGKMVQDDAFQPDEDTVLGIDNGLDSLAQTL